MRGTFLIDAIDTVANGLTPAGAGNIAYPYGAYFTIEAHPRRCGEHTYWQDNLCLDAGSPPQVRGTSPHRSRARSVEGLTPAGAGNIATNPGGLFRRGLTPAGAGNIRRRLASAGCPGAHPRRCGEHPTRLLSNGWCMGSPPQVRGTSAVHAWRRDSTRAHPRRCGEHLIHHASPALPTGSPPQVRGTSRVNRGKESWMRLTPAGAGNICYSRRARGRREAHPRRCGEHVLFPLVGTIVAGSPPQVRGTSSPSPAYCGQSGLTPAGAGNIQ